MGDFLFGLVFGSVLGFFIFALCNANKVVVDQSEWTKINDALKKQIPKKAKVIFDEYSYFECENCGEAIYCSDELKSHRYCLNCGQALDWSDSE